MKNIIPNPPNFNKRIIFNFKLFMVAVSDLVIFTLLSLVFLPLIIFIWNATFQIVFTVIYIVLIILALFRYDGMWIRDFVFLFLKYLFSRKNFIEDHAKKFTDLGKIVNGYFFNNNKFSKFFEIDGVDISLIRENELEKRIEAMNNFFMFSENIKITLISLDKKIEISQYLDKLTTTTDDPIYQLLNWNEYQQFDSIKNRNITRKIYILKIEGNDYQTINNAFRISKMRLQLASIFLKELSLNDVSLIQQKLFNKKPNAKLYEQQTETIYSDIKKITISPNNYSITCAKKIDGQIKFINHYFKIMCVKDNPKYADFMWLNNIYNTDGLSVFHILQANTARSGKEYVNSTSRTLKFKFDNLRDDIVEESKTLRYYEQIENTAEWIGSGTSTLLNSKMFIVIDAPSAKILRKKTQKVKEYVRVDKIKINELKFQQLDALKILTEAK